MINNNRKLAYLAFAMYFITGVVCMLVGSNMSSLVEFYDKPVEKIVLLGSSFAIGRTVSVYLIGKLTEKYGPLKIMFAGVCGMLAFMMGTVLVSDYYLAFVWAFLGGMGMSCQDATCPLILSRVFTKNYSSSLSAGQSLYGLGGFAISFLIGLMLNYHVPFGWANALLALVGLSMLVIIPSTKWDGASAVEEEKVKPIVLDNSKPAKIIMCIICFVYCSACSCLSIYMTSNMEALGNSQAVSSYVLSAYNLASVIGSIVFIFILRKIPEKTVLLGNSIINLCVFSATVMLNRSELYYIGMPVTGFFVGVLFSIIIAIATRIDYEHISIAGAYIAIAGSIGDITTPLYTSKLVETYGVTFINKVVIVLLVIMTVLSAVINIITRKEA